jgi:hypothetical protein
MVFNKADTIFFNKHQSFRSSLEKLAGFCLMIEAFTCLLWHGGFKSNSCSTIIRDDATAHLTKKKLLSGGFLFSQFITDIEALPVP